MARWLPTCVTPTTSKSTTLGCWTTRTTLFASTKEKVWRPTSHASTRERATAMPSRCGRLLMQEGMRSPPSSRRAPTSLTGWGSTSTVRKTGSFVMVSMCRWWPAIMTSPMRAPGIMWPSTWCADRRPASISTDSARPSSPRRRCRLCRGLVSPLAVACNRSPTSTKCASGTPPSRRADC